MSGLPQTEVVEVFIKFSSLDTNESRILRVTAYLPTHFTTETIEFSTEAISPSKIEELNKYRIRQIEVLESLVYQFDSLDKNHLTKLLNLGEKYTKLNSVAVIPLKIIDIYYVAVMVLEYQTGYLDNGIRDIRLFSISRYLLSTESKRQRTCVLGDYPKDLITYFNKMWFGSVVCDNLTVDNLKEVYESYSMFDSALDLPPRERDIARIIDRLEPATVAINEDGTVVYLSSTWDEAQRFSEQANYFKAIQECQIKGPSIRKLNLSYLDLSHFKRFLSGYDPRVRFLVDGINDNESLLYFTTSQNKAVVSLTLDSLYKFTSDLSKFSSTTKMTPIVKLSELQSNIELFRSCLNFNVIEARSSQSNIMTASSKKILVGDYTDTILELIDKPIIVVGADHLGDYILYITEGVSLARVALDTSLTMSGWVIGAQKAFEAKADPNNMLGFTTEQTEQIIQHITEQLAV